MLGRQYIMRFIQNKKNKDNQTTKTILPLLYDSGQGHNHL